uniref:Uncharacterized protein n=1 Tax=Onchocerca volvulus TaxID=6282 RepID=A0A8R1XZE6_ONCVO
MQWIKLLSIENQHFLPRCVFNLTEGRSQCFNTIKNANEIREWHMSFIKISSAASLLYRFVRRR